MGEPTRTAIIDEKVYEAIARNLREFGYPDVTAQMIRETDEARQNGAGPSEPHGIISLFANRQISDAEIEADDE